jgi:FkbM family methyltransferase
MEFITSWRIKHRQLFFSELLPEQAFCLDIGANNGEYSAAFLALGARRVVAVEPQKELADFIVSAFPREIQNGTLFVKALAVGAAPGVAKLYPASDAGKSMSTLSPLFVEVSRANGQQWDDSQIHDVAVTTLDHLIAEFGVPDYIKIDVEGFDLEVLRGLSQPISLLSFEFNSQRNLIDIAVACIAQIETLGNYEFNYQVEAAGETGIQFEKWVSAGVMQYTLCHDIARVAVFGDIFARLKTA